MEDPLEATNDREQRERGLHRHAIVPSAFGTQFAVLWHAILAAKAVISQDNAAPTELLNERMELVIRDIHRVPIPIDYLTKAVEDPTQLDPDAESGPSLSTFCRTGSDFGLAEWETATRLGSGQSPGKSSDRPGTARSNPDG